MDLLNLLSLFVFINCVIFNLKYVFQFFINMKSENPEAIDVSPINKLFMLLSTSYILTFLIAIIFN